MRRSFATALLLLVLAACSGEAPPSGPEAGAFDGSWAKLPASPLSARHEAHVYVLGRTILVAGGRDTPPCPPNADCILPAEQPLRDGAAFDLATKKWRRIAPAPVPLGSASGAVSGRTLYLLVTVMDPVPGKAHDFTTRHVFVSYEADADRWSTLPAPPAPQEGLRLVAAAEDVVAYLGTQERIVRPDVIFVRRAKAWRPLPRDPLVPSFDRSVVWTGTKLVLVAPKNVPQPGSEAPSVYRSAALDLGTRTWKRLIDLPVVAWDPSWFFAGGVVVNATVGTADGGEVNNWGRRLPFGGILDPATARWRALPPAPAAGTYRGPAAANDRFVTSTGRVLNVKEQQWARLSLPAELSGGYAVAWAGDSFALWGGYTFEAAGAVLSADGWLWTPAGDDATES